MHKVAVNLVVSPTDITGTSDERLGVATFGAEGRRGRSRLFVLTFTVFVDLVGFGIIIPLLPFYAETLGADPTALGILIATFSLMQFIFSPIFGRLSDRLGRRPVILASLVLSTVGHLTFALSSSLLLLFLSRILAGIGSANLSVAQAYIADSTTAARRAKGMGLIGAAFGVGFVVGPVIGGSLSIYGFWAAGLVAAAIAFSNFLLAVIFLPESFPPSVPSTHDASPSSRRGFIGAFRRPIVGSLLVVFFVVNFSFSAVPVIYPLLLIASFNLSPSHMALIFTYIGALQIFMQGFMIERLVKPLGEEKFLAMGTLLMAASILITPFTSNFIVFMVLTGVLAMGVSITSTIIPSLISKRSSANEQGSILGIAQSAASLARVPGPSMAGILFEYAGIAVPFIASASLMFAGLGLSVRVYLRSLKQE